MPSKTRTAPAAPSRRRNPPASAAAPVDAVTPPTPVPAVPARKTRPSRAAATPASATPAETPAAAAKAAAGKGSGKAPAKASAKAPAKTAGKTKARAVAPDASAEATPPAKAAAKPPAKTPAKAAPARPATASRKTKADATNKAGDKAGDKAASKRAGRGRKAEAPAAAPELPPLAAPAARISVPPGGALFGAYRVELPDEEVADVTLRSPFAGTAWCTCLDFELSEHADCPHLQALTSTLQADPARRQALAQGPQAVSSRLAVLHAARRRLLWLPGTECPQSLNDLADELLGVPPEALSDQAVPRLLRAAREAGHDLQVDEAVWTQLAAARDARWRVHRLQAVLPDGPACSTLAALHPRPLLPLQWEAALFAVCAGRVMLADAAELQPAEQALAAAAVWQRHFGVERVLVLSPAARLDHWRALLPAQAEGWSLMALESVAADDTLHRSLQPQLLIVDEPAAGGLWVDAERAAALLRLPAPFVIVLPGEAALAEGERLAEWPLRLAFIDPHRLGAYAALLDVHGRRDANGELCGLQQAGQLRDTLAPVLLARTLEAVRDQLPERLDRVLPVPLPAADVARHDALAAALAARVARHQAMGWMSDGTQRELFDALQPLRRLCAGEGAQGVAEAKARATLQVLAEAETPLVVFSQWPGALQALQERLQAAGVGVAFWSGDEPAPARQAAAAALNEGRARVLLVADAGGQALGLARADIRVLHLDSPWHPRLLARRFGRVHRRASARLVPVVHLLAADSFEQRLQALPDDGQPPRPDVLDANAGDGFVQGEALGKLLADLVQLLAPAMRVPAPLR